MIMVRFAHDGALPRGILRGEVLVACHKSLDAAFVGR